MRKYLLDSALIIHVLARAGHAHRCARCQRPTLVKYESGLCIFCFNGVERDPARDAFPPLTARPALPEPRPH